jgi:hypothetical protein
VRILNLVRSALPSAYAAKARGVVLCAITVSAAYVYYLAVDAEDAIPPAAADSIPAPPVVRAASITQPIHIIPDAAAHEIAAAPIPDRAIVTRNLQTAVASAVETPSSISPSETPGAPVDERSMLDHPWARPEMLVPSREMTTPAATAPIAVSGAEPAGRDTTQAAPVAAPVASVEAALAPAVMQVSTAASGGPMLHFEGGSVVSDTKPEIAPSPPATAAPAKVAQRKSKSAKRRASRSNDSDFGVSFDSIQRSLSSLFD